MGYGYIEDWARSNAIIVDNMDSYGSPIRDDSRRLEIRKANSKEEGKYTINAGVLAFVLNGQCYATPLVEEASRVLENAGFEYTSNIWVPFGSIGSFPGALSSDIEKELWFEQNGSLSDDPAWRVRRYYEEVVRIHNGYHNWVRLLKRNGEYRPEADPILYRIGVLAEDREEYNEYARQEAQRMLFESERKSYR